MSAWGASWSCSASVMLIAVCRPIPLGRMLRCGYTRQTLRRGVFRRAARGCRQARARGARCSMAPAWSARLESITMNRFAVVTCGGGFARLKACYVCGSRAGGQPATTTRRGARGEGHHCRPGSLPAAQRHPRHLITRSIIQLVDVSLASALHPPPAATENSKEEERHDRGIHFPIRAPVRCQPNRGRRRRIRTVQTRPAVGTVATCCLSPSRTRAKYFPAGDPEVAVETFLQRRGLLL